MKDITRILRISIIGLFVLALGSCSDDFLQKVPTDSVSTDIALGDVDNMVLALNGMHRTIYAQNNLGINSYAGQQYMLPCYEYGAGDALHSVTGNGWFRELLQWLRHTTQTSIDVYYGWTHHYNMIASANNIINAAAEMPESEELNNVLGQAYTYRAWAHFALVRLFGKAYMIGDPSTDLGVPIMKATAAPYEGLSRSTVQEVYDFIIEDLNTAITAFENGSTSRVDLSNLNIDVAHGVAARVYLTIGQWDNAATHAAEARADYPLMTETEYKSGFNSWSNPEWIWGSQIIQDQTTYYRAYFYYCSNNFNGTQSRGNPKFINHELYDMIEDTDYRKDLFLRDCPSTFDDWDAGDNEGRYETEKEYDDAVKEYRTIVNNGESHNMVPYMHIKLSQSNGSTIDPMDLVLMRSSEMYLIEAEALAKQGKDSEAQDILYLLASERDEAYTKSTNTGDALVEEILIQRRIELFIEGHRWFDILRNDESLDLTNSGADASLYLDGMEQDRPSVNDAWIWQIPEDELNANPNMVQN